MAAAALLFFVYLGFEEIANLAEEVRDPGRDLADCAFCQPGESRPVFMSRCPLPFLCLATPAELAGERGTARRCSAKSMVRARPVRLSCNRPFCHCKHCPDHGHSNLASCLFDVTRKRNIQCLFAQFLPVEADAVACRDT